MDGSVNTEPGRASEFFWDAMSMAFCKGLESFVDSFAIPFSWVLDTCSSRPSICHLSDPGTGTELPHPLDLLTSAHTLLFFALLLVFGWYPSSKNC